MLWERPANPYSSIPPLRPRQTSSWFSPSVTLMTPVGILAWWQRLLFSSITRESPQQPTSTRVEFLEFGLIAIRAGNVNCLPHQCRVQPEGGADRYSFAREIDPPRHSRQATLEQASPVFLSGQDNWNNSLPANYIISTRQARNSFTTCASKRCVRKASSQVWRQKKSPQRGLSICDLNALKALSM